MHKFSYLHDRNLKKQIGSKVVLFQILQKHTGVNFRPEIKSKFQDNPTLFEEPEPFNEKDVEIKPE